MTIASKSPHLDLESLFGRAQQGDIHCLNAFCGAIRGGLIAIATYRLPGKSRELVEDIVQDTLAIFSQKVAEVNTSPTAYVRGILYRRIGNELQRLSGSTSVTLDGDHPAAATPAHFVRQVEDRDTIQTCATAIRRMGEPCRSLLVGILRGLSVGEIWATFREGHPEMKRSAFDHRLYLCRRHLLKLMEVDL
ncbi:MAG TPA: hypothetical protein VGL38_11800 [bacterium]|jgi:DNA-directed RNA polymerase specialized sigma24 family protein